MIDPAVTRISKWIVQELFPSIRNFFTNFFESTIFDTMTTEEIQIYFIKIAIHALILIVLYSIGLKLAKWTERRSRRKKPKHQRKKEKKIWSPTGWYWDEEKGSWIPPDYISEDGKNRWKWDPEKRIWIDQNPKD